MLVLITPEGAWLIPGPPRVVVTDETADAWTGENLPYPLYHRFRQIRGST